MDLLCDTEDRPVGVEVFSGNTATTRTVQLQKLKERVGLSRARIVEDRGLLTHARLAEEVRGAMTGSPVCTNGPTAVLEGLGASGNE